MHRQSRSKMPDGVAESGRGESESEPEDDAEWGSRIQSASYWNARYAKDEAPFEWYCSYEQVEGLLTGCLTKGSRVLEIGCGNSELSLGLHKSGYEVVATDYAQGQIDLLNQLYADLVEMSASSPSRPSLRFESTDCRELITAFGPESFDAIVDKACLDSMLSGGSDTAEATCRQISTVLRPNGHFIIISHASPESDLGDLLLRKVILENLDLQNFRWNVDIHSSEELGDEFVHIYILHKVLRPRTRLEMARRQLGVDRLSEVCVHRHWH